MLELYLNGSRVYPDSQLKIKLTKENPYFSQSDTYTLEVSLPADILENRRLMRNLHRMETSKQVQRMTARLLVDNHPLLTGSAIVTQVTHDAVKVQLIQGLPSLKLLMNDNDDFIDQIEMGTGDNPSGKGPIGLSADFKAKGVKGEYVYLPIYNENTDKIMNPYFYDQDDNVVRYGEYHVADNRRAVQPNLLYVLKKVFAHYGFTLDLGTYDQEPWNCIYIANCKYTLKLSKALPHWRSSDFFTEAANFLCAKYIVNEATRKVKLTPMKDYFSENTDTIEPVSEYQTDIEEETEQQELLSANIKYAASSSLFHEWDIIDQKVVRACEPITYASYDALTANDNATPHKNNILDCPTGYYAYWERTNKDTTPPCRRNKGVARMQVNQFGELIRDENSDKSIELKICPVAMTDTQHLGDKRTAYYIYTHMPSMSEYEYEAASIDETTAQERIESAYEAEDGKEQSSDDLMQVFLFDNQFMLTEYQNTAVPHEYQLRLPMAFTDALALLPTSVGGSHEPWSLALTHCPLTKYIGQLHQVTALFDTKAKHTFKFVSTHIPDPSNLFLIRGKLYACEKIEASVTPEGFDPLMTGYFYEMLS